jgi:hypothetical protein
MSVVPGTILPPICVITYWPTQDVGVAVAVGVGEAVGVDVGVTVGVDDVGVGVGEAVGVGVGASADPLVVCPNANELFVGSMAESVAFCCPSASRITNADRSRSR